jgi:hypothetical protein
MSAHIQSVDIEASCIESSTPTQPTKTPLVSSAADAKRSISFNPITLTTLIIHFHEYSDEEIAASWYCQYELRKIKSDLKTTLMLMANGSIMPGSDQLCSRGLESFTSEGRAIKKQNREEARIAVLEQQDYQLENDIFEPEMIADAYLEQTSKSQATATVFGFYDQEAVQQQPLPSLPNKMSMKVGPPRSNSIGCLDLESMKPLKFLSMAA